MKNYIIKTSHETDIDSYNEGQGKNVNYYQEESQIKARTPREAITQYFKNVLYYTFEFDNAYIIHEEKGKNTLFYDVLVDEESMEASQNQIELWKKGEKTLYNNRIHLSIYELNPAII
jgi:hypothetical protein